MGVPNTFHQDCFSVVFSNVPTADGSKVDMRIFDLYVKSLTLPDLSLNVVDSDFMNSSVRSPISRKNSDPNPLSIEFKASEDLLNYFTLHTYLKMLKYGISEFNKNVLRDTNIGSITIELKDNEKRKIGEFVFTNCLITSIGTLNLQYGVSDELTFPATFTYEEMKLNLYTIETI